jgi:heptosyltransferase I
MLRRCAETSSGVDSVITISLRTWKKNLRKKSTWIGLYKSIKAIRENHYDIIIDFQGLLKSAFFTLFTRGDIHGFDKPLSEKEPPLTFINSHILYQSKFMQLFGIEN